MAMSKVHHEYFEGVMDWVKPILVEVYVPGNMEKFRMPPSIECICMPPSKLLCPFDEERKKELLAYQNPRFDDAYKAFNCVNGKITVLGHSDVGMPTGRAFGIHFLGSRSTPRQRASICEVMVGRI